VDVISVVVAHIAHPRSYRIGSSCTSAIACFDKGQRNASGNTSLSASDSITISVYCRWTDVIRRYFKLTKTTSLQTLMDKYCKIHNRRRDIIYFFYNGYPIFDADTPSDLCMRGGDEIEAIPYVIGGV